MTRFSSPVFRFLLVLAVGFGVAWAASAQPANRLDARLDRLGERLSLTAEQSAALDAIAARHAQADRADLWTVSAGVRDVLTNTQIAQLREVRGERAQRRGDRSARQDRGGRDRRGAQRADRARQPRDRRTGVRRADLTDAQRESIRAIRQEARTRRQALVEQLRAGTISDQDFAEQTQALRDDAARRAAAAMPDAEERLDARTERREEAEAARDRALELTDVQKARLLALRLDRVRQSPERLDVRPYLDDQGRLDRAAYRQAMQKQREARRESAQASRQQADEVLTQEQRDLMMVHRALAGGGQGRGRRAGRWVGRGR